MDKFYIICTYIVGVALQVNFTVTGIYSMLKDIALHSLFEFRILLKITLARTCRSSFTFLINTCIFGSAVKQVGHQRWQSPKKSSRDFIISKTGTVIIPIPDSILPNSKFTFHGLGRNTTQSIGPLSVSPGHVFFHRETFLEKPEDSGFGCNHAVQMHRAVGCRDSRACAFQTATAEWACWAVPLGPWQQTWCALGKWQQTWCPLGQWQQTWHSLGQWQQTWHPRGQG